MKLTGDVQFDDECAERALAVTPVPGGVGPLTVASLMENVCELFEREMEIDSSEMAGLPAHETGVQTPPQARATSQQAEEWLRSLNPYNEGLL